MKAPPDEVKLSREEGQALIERLRANALTSEDRGLLVKLVQLYFWFTFGYSGDCDHSFRGESSSHSGGLRPLIPG